MLAYSWSSVIGKVFERFTFIGCSRRYLCRNRHLVLLDRYDYYYARVNIYIQLVFCSIERIVFAGERDWPLIAFPYNCVQFPLHSAHYYCVTNGLLPNLVLPTALVGIHL